MKNLKQLGISPAPWTYNNYGAILSDSHGVVFDEQMNPKEARLIAAAPELYEALYKCVIALDHIYEYEGFEFGTLDEYNAAKAALAKASGEEVAK